MIIKVELQVRVENVASEVCDLTVPDDLFRYRNFLEIYETPIPFAAAAIELYADRAVPMLHKQIVGYAMQRLPIEQLVSLVSSVADLTSQKVIPPALLELIAFPPLNWGVQLRVDYERHDVNALLKRLAAMDEVSSDIGAYIRERVLTGLAKEDVCELREAGQIP